MPTAWAAIPMRPPSSVVIAILNPSPSSPSRSAAGTRTSVRKISTVPDALTPSLTWWRERSKPAEDASTRNAEMPRVFFSGFVMAKRRQTSAAWPQVMNTFWPEIRYASPSRVARVFWLPASDPASGSVRAKQPSFSPRASGVRNLFF